MGCGLEIWRLERGLVIELIKAYKDIKTVCMCLLFKNPEHWSEERGALHCAAGINLKIYLCTETDRCIITLLAGWLRQSGDTITCMLFSSICNCT